MKLLSIMPDLPKEILGSRENEHVDVTVFYFWSQDCSYCKQWPQFVESVNAQFGSRLHCVVVHVGELSNEKRIDSELLDCYVDEDELLTAAFGVRSFPAIFIFDKEQKLRYQQSGSAQTRLLINRIQKFLHD